MPYHNTVNSNINGLNKLLQISTKYKTLLLWWSGSFSQVKALFLHKNLWFPLKNHQNLIFLVHKRFQLKHLFFFGQPKTTAQACFKPLFQTPARTKPNLRAARTAAWGWRKHGDPVDLLGCRGRSFARMLVTHNLSVWLRQGVAWGGWGCWTRWHWHCPGCCPGGAASCAEPLPWHWMLAGEKQRGRNRG